MRITLVALVIAAAASTVACVGNKTEPAADASPAQPTSSAMTPTFPMRPLTKMPTLRYQPPSDAAAIPSPDNR